MKDPVVIAFHMIFGILDSVNESTLSLVDVIHQREIGH